MLRRIRILAAAYRRLMLLAPVLAALAVAGCGPTITDGTIVRKEHEVPYAETIHSTMYINSGDVLIPFTTSSEVYHPEAWYFHLRKGELEGRIQVGRPTYEKFAEGDYYSSL